MEEIKDINAEIQPPRSTPPPTLRPVTHEPLPWIFEVAVYLTSL